MRIRSKMILVPLYIGIFMKLTLSFPFIVHGQNTSGDVVINEIMWMGSTTSANDEFIELRNMTANSIDLSGWVVENLGSGLQVDITLPIGLTIAPNGYIVIADRTATTSILSTEPDYQNGNISLTNTGEQLVLKDDEGTIIDTANGTGAWFVGTNEEKKSMERNSNPDDGTSAGSWHLATTAVNLDSGVVDLATPGWANVNVDETPTPTETVSPTSTPEPTPTSTPTNTPTQALEPTATSTPSPTVTPSPSTTVPTTTPTQAIEPSATPTKTPTPTKISHYDDKQCKNKDDNHHYGNNTFADRIKKHNFRSNWGKIKQKFFSKGWPRFN